MKKTESGSGTPFVSTGPSARSMVKSLVVHACGLTFVLLLPARALSHSLVPGEVQVVFHRPQPPAEVPPPRPLPPTAALPRGPLAGEEPGPKARRVTPPVSAPVPPEPTESAPGDPLEPVNPDVAPGPEGPVTADPEPEKKPGKSGILAFKDQFASLAQDKVTPRLGAEARVGDADDRSDGSATSLLTTNDPGSSGGINLASLTRRVGGGGGGGGGGGSGGAGGGGIQRIQTGHPTSSIAGIGGGSRPLAKNGPGASRTDEEIQIVFDRYKAQFYRLYSRELRKDPTLKGQMVLRLTIEPDGSVSMCRLQSSDMNAPDLAAQVVDITRTINFGAKEGVEALTILYPIDFLPASA